MYYNGKKILSVFKAVGEGGSSNYDELTNIPIINADLDALSANTAQQDQLYRHNGASATNYKIGMLYYSNGTSWVAVINEGTGGGSDLTNYYTKDETYSQKEVDELISGIETGGTGGESGVVSNEAVDFAESERLKTINLSYWKLGSINTSTGKYAASTKRATAEFSVEAGQIYTINIPRSRFRNCIILDNNNNALGSHELLQYSNETDTSFSFICSESGTIKFVISNVDSDTSINIDEYNNSIQVEKGSVVTEYQAYMGEILHKMNGGVVEAELLWQNPNPTSAFSAQTITFAHGNYDNLLFLVKGTPTSTNMYVHWGIKGTNTYIAVANLHTTSGTLNQSRQFTRVSDTQYSVGEGKTGLAGSAIATNNEIVIPYQIYGVKLKGVSV